MLRSNTGISNLKNPKEAGKMAAIDAKKGLANMKLAFVYGSADYNLSEMLAGVKEEMHGVPLIGNTSFTGVITPQGHITGDDGFVGIMALSGEYLDIGVAGFKRGNDPRETGRQAAFSAMKHAGVTKAPDFFYMAASPGEEEFYLKGITDIIGRVPYFGGSAADNKIAGEWMLYTHQELFADGVVVAFFYTDYKATNLFKGAYRETEDMGIITKVDNYRTLMEIDGVPALKKYATWTQVEADTLLGDVLLSETITSPLGVKDHLGDITLIRHPMNGNDDYSMNIGANLAEKTCVIRMEATVDELIESATTTLKELKENLKGTPKAYHLVHCGGRKAGIGDRIGEVETAIKKEAGDVPFIMEFTFGEYGFEDDGKNAIGGLMLSYTALCE